MSRAKKSRKPRPARPFPKKQCYPTFDILESRLPISEQIGTLLGISALYAASEQLQHGLESLPRASGVTPGAHHHDVADNERISLIPSGSFRPQEEASAPAVSGNTVMSNGGTSFVEIVPGVGQGGDLGEPTLEAWDRQPFEVLGTLTLQPRTKATSAWAEEATAGPIGAGSGWVGLPPGSGGADAPAAETEDESGGTGRAAGPARLDESHWLGLLGLTNGVSPVATGAPAADALDSGPSTEPPPGRDPPGRPRPLPPRRRPRRTGDPLWVLDANYAIVVNEYVVKHDFSGYAVDLRAQVSGANVANYQWSHDNDYPGDFVNWSAGNNYNLTFTWGSFTGVHNHTITIQTTNVGGGGITQNLSFRVYGTDSPARSSTAPTSWATWQPNSTLTVLPPDALTREQETVDSQYYRLGLAAGDLQVPHSLPTYNTGIPPATLVYNSEAAGRYPIFLGHYQLGSGVTQVDAELKLNGVSQGVYSYNTSLLNAGDIMEIAQLAVASTLSTGRYTYEFKVTPNAGSATTFTGSVNIIDSRSSVFSNGWSLASVQRLWPLGGTGGPSGAILELPGGLSLWFAPTGSENSFTPPVNDSDFSTLIWNGTNYIRTLKDGTKVYFDSTGKQTLLVDRNSNTTTFTYDGSSNLSTIKDFNNQVTTFGYSSGKVQTITDPASRLTTLSYSSGRLSTITDPDPDGAGSLAAPVTSFSYDSTDRMTRLTDPRSNGTTWVYDGAGRVAEIQRPDSVAEHLTPLQDWGLSGGGLTTPVLAVEAQAYYQDGETNYWASRLDWLGFGRATQQQNPLGYESVSYRDGNGLAWLAADPLARRTRLFYDSKGNPTKVVFPDDNKEEYTYNTTFSLVTTRKEAGNQVTTYTRDASTGNLTQITQPDPGDSSGTPTIGYDYYTGGWLKTITDPRGNTTTLVYDSTIKNRLTQVIYPEGTCSSACPSVTYDYDSAGNQRRRTDERGYSTTVVYDNLNRSTQLILPVESGSNPVYTYGYDAASNQITAINPLGKITTQGYDSLNRRTSVTDPLSHTWTYTYDNNHMLRRVTDPLSHKTTYSYDAADHLVGVTDALVHTWVYDYDAAGQRVAVTSPLGHTTSYAYHLRGWLQTVTNPLLGELRYGYNANGDQTTITEYDPGPPSQTFTTTYAYDNLHRLTRYTDPRGNAITYTYDRAGNRLSVEGSVRGNSAADADEGSGCSCECSCDPCAVEMDHGTFSFTYDKRNRRVTVKDKLGNVTTVAHDPAGNCTSVQLAHTELTGPNPPTEYGYDAQNRIKWIKDPNGYYVTFTFDLAGRQETVKDPDNNVTTYVYDDAGRHVRTLDPNNKTTTYVYDNANRLTEVADRMNRRTSYVYDDADRRTQEQWLNGSGSSIRTFTYVYDDDNRLTGAQDPASVHTYGYDNAGRPTSVNASSPLGMPQVLLTYTYDGLHNRIGLRDNLGAGGVLSYTYNGNHDLTEVSLKVGSTNGPKVTFTYDTLNRPDGITRTSPGGATITTAIGYDLNDRLTTITHSVGAVTLALYTYHYDARNRVDGYTGGADEGSRTYVYDLTNQLTTVKNASTGSDLESYTYDPAGNRTQANGVTYGTPGTGNRLLDDGVHTYTYDDEGNMLTRRKISNGDLTTFTWDYRDRLTSVQTSTVYDTFTYDVHNRRIGKVTNGGAQQWTAYDEANPYVDFSGSTLTKRYLYGRAVDKLFASTDATAGSTSWYMTDRLGSVRQNVNASGSPVNTITYESYGKISSETAPANGDRFKYTSREWDSEIGLQYNRARYYNPGVGRWISEDPIGFKGGDNNLYRYVKNSPVQFSDPSGLQLPAEAGGKVLRAGVEAAETLAWYNTGKVSCRVNIDDKRPGEIWYSGETLNATDWAFWWIGFIPIPIWSTTPCKLVCKKGADGKIYAQLPYEAANGCRAWAWYEVGSWK